MRQRVKARRLQRRVEYFEAQRVADGFGGSTVELIKVAEYWAEVRTSNPSSTIDENATLGQVDFSQIYKITVRSKVAWSDAKKYEIRFGGKRFEVINVVEVDLRGTKIEITAREYLTA